MSRKVDEHHEIVQQTVEKFGKEGGSPAEVLG